MSKFITFFFLISLSFSAMAAKQTIYFVIETGSESIVHSIDVSRKYLRHENLAASVKYGKNIYEVSLMNCKKSRCLVDLTIKDSETYNSVMANSMYSYASHKSFYAAVTIDSLNYSRLMAMSATQYKRIARDYDYPNYVQSVTPNYGLGYPETYDSFIEGYLYYNSVEVQGGPFDPRY